jgi:hypothetical protein
MTSPWAQRLRAEWPWWLSIVLGAYFVGVLKSGSGGSLLLVEAAARTIGNLPVYGLAFLIGTRFWRPAVGIVLAFVVVEIGEETLGQLARADRFAPGRVAGAAVLGILFGAAVAGLAFFVARLRGPVSRSSSRGDV